MIEDAWRIVGGKPLEGSVRPSGSKNGSLPTLAAALLMDGETVLRNVPDIADIRTMVGLLRALGLQVEGKGDGSLSIVNRGLAPSGALEDLVGEMRASHYILAPLALRLGRADIPLPGGCRIGSRSVDHFLAVLNALGAQAHEVDGRISVSASGLTGSRVVLEARYLNPGATFTALMAGALAGGSTVVENASTEPDIIAFCRFLSAAGARIEGIGETTLHITGVASLHGVTHEINPDRLEAGTFLSAAAATRGDVTIEGFTRSDLGIIADTAEGAGIECTDTAAGLRVRCQGRPRGVSIVTRPYPGFPTDLQPPVAAVLATAQGESTIEESIYDDRLQYVEELNKMGARVSRVDARHAAITGVDRLTGASVVGRNIRDGAALIVAALSADGESTVGGRKYVARGYEGIETKLRSLGAEITPAG